MSASRRDRIQGAEAGLKYFILGSVASGILLFGMAILYGLTGSMIFNEIWILLVGVNSIGVVLASVFIFSAIFFKLAAAPFHMWAPDVYEGSPLL